MSERYEWLTDGMSPAYGMEFTHQLRVDPRVLLTFDGLESATNRRWLENELALHGAGRWHVPLVVDAGRTTGVALATEFLVAVDTRHRRYVPGGNAMLIMPDAPRRTEVVQIASVDEDWIELVDALQADWPEGSLIMPTLGCWLQETPQFSRFTGDDAPYSVTFVGAEPMAFTADFGGATYRDIPVFEQDVHWTQDPAYAPARRVETLDDGIGPILLHDQGGMVLPRVQVEVTAMSAAEIATHRALLAAMAGRHHPIWVPSYAADFLLLAVASST